jgi:hypothetical protein
VGAGMVFVYHVVFLFGVIYAGLLGLAKLFAKLLKRQKED